jgi:hypothetical protein
MYFFLDQIWVEALLKLQSSLRTTINILNLVGLKKNWRLITFGFKHLRIIIAIRQKDLSPTYVPDGELKSGKSIATAINVSGIFEFGT